MSEANKAIIRNVREHIIRSRDLSRLDSLYTENYVYHGIPLLGDTLGVQAFKQMISSLMAGMSDSRETVADQIAEGDKVVTRLSTA